MNDPDRANLRDRWNRLGKGPQVLIMGTGLIILGLLLFHWGTEIGRAIYLAVQD